MPLAPPQPMTPCGVFLLLWHCNRAPPLRRSPHRQALSGNHARLRAILDRAMTRLVDAAVDHDCPRDPRGLVGDGYRCLLLRHATEQLRDPGMLVRADLAWRTMAIAPAMRS